MKKTILLTAALVLALAPVVQADALVYEPFDYNVGDDVNGKTPQGATWTAGGGTVTAAGKTYTDPNSNQLIVAGQHMNYSGGPQLTIDTSLWPASHKNAAGDALGAPGATIWMSYIRKGADATSGYYEDISVGSPQLLLGKYYWQDVVSSINTFPGADPTTVSVADETFVLVRHATDLNGDTVVDLWAGPVPLDNEAGLPLLDDPTATEDYMSNTAGDPYVGGHTFSVLNFRNGGGARSYDYDEIRLGMTYADVTPFVPEPATTLAITSITSVGGGNWELTLAGKPDTGYEFRSSPILEFDPGDLVDSLTQNDPTNDPGTVTDSNLLTTDSNGDGTVRMMLTGNPADFVRAQIPPPPPPVLEEYFEEVTGPTPPTDWTRSDSGDGTSWEVGVPSGSATGPDAAANGTQCAGTNIGGDYTASAEASLVTKAFTVPDDGATLSFSQYIDTDLDGTKTEVGSIRLLNAGDNSVLAGGDVAIELEGITEAWSSESIPLPDVANGLSVKLEFRFVSNATDEFAGFYIDDVVVTAN